MGLSIRAREKLDERLRDEAIARRVADAQRQAEAAAYHAAFLDRERAAEFLGISTHKLKRMMAAGTGPACVKNGETRQATVRWRLGELQAFKASLEQTT